MSSISSTDERLFKTLANTDVVDVNRMDAVREMPFEHDDGGSYEEEEEEEETEAQRPPPAMSHFDSVVNEHMARRSVRAESISSVRQARRATPAPNMPSVPPMPPMPPGRDSPDDMLAKQSVLLDLDRLRLRGVRLTREYTIADNLEDMTFELQRHLSHIDEESTVSMMRDVVRVMCTGIEMGNARFGPWLELDGWSTEVCSDIGRFDPALSGLYRKYFRRGTSSPEMQMVTALAGSVSVYHLKKKFLDGKSDVLGGGGFNLGGIAANLFGGNSNNVRPSAPLPPTTPVTIPVTVAARPVLADSDDEAAPEDL